MSTVVRPAAPYDRSGVGLSPTKDRHQRGSRRDDVAAWHVLGSAVTDILLIGLSGLLAYQLRFSVSFLSLGRDFHGHLLQLPQGAPRIYLGLLLVYAALVVLAGYSQRLDKLAAHSSPWKVSLLVGRAVTVATVILGAFIYLSGIKTVSRLVVGLTASFSLLTLAGWRLWWWQRLHRKFAKGIGLRHAVIIDAGGAGKQLADYLQANPALGYDVRGFLDSNHHNDPRILGTPDDLARVARQEFIDDVFITVASERQLVKQVALEAMRLNLSVRVVPELYDGLARQCPLEFLGEVPVLTLRRKPIPAFGLFLKRVTDIVGSAVGLVLLSPLMILIALAVKIDSRGPIFYRSYRVGKKGRKFLCYKFRTMVPNADDMKHELKHLNERQGLLFKISNDPRLTRIGGFLRKFSLDELPQLWNVLRGEMSLVGPRPPTPDEFENYTLEHLRRLDVTPGITGLWQIEARNDPSFERAVALDSKYIENWSYFRDLKILLRTIPVVLKGTGR